MSRTKPVAVAFLLASAVVQANHYSHDVECPSDGEPQNGVLLLQTKLQTNVIEDSVETVKKLAQVDARARAQGPDAMEVMQKASSHARHLATIRPPKPMTLRGNITLNFQSAVPTFGAAGNYIALLHKFNDTLWHEFKDRELFCSGPGNSHRVLMRILGTDNPVFQQTHIIWHCDWPKEEAHAGSYQVFLEEADGTKIGHLDTSYDPMLLKEYNTVACVTSIWPGTKGLSEVPQWLEYNLIHGVDHFLVYTMTGTDERLMDIYRHYLNDTVATRVHLEIPSRLSGEYKAEGYSTQAWLANDCLYRMKNHAKWMSPTIDVDEYFRLNQSTQVHDGPKISGEINYGASPWDRIKSNWVGFPQNVHSLSFGRYRFLRAQDTGALQISSSMRGEHLANVEPKFVVNPALVNALFIHWPTSWVNGSVGLGVPSQLGVGNHYRTDDPSSTTTQDLALVAEVPAVIEAIEARFKSKWESLASKLQSGAMQQGASTMLGKERVPFQNQLSMELRAWIDDFNKLDQISIIEPPRMRSSPSSAKKTIH